MAGMTQEAIIKWALGLLLLGIVVWAIYPLITKNVDNAQKVASCKGINQFNGDCIPQGEQLNQKEGQGFICVQSGCKPETGYDKTLKYYCCSKIDSGSSKT